MGSFWEHFPLTLVQLLSCVWFFVIPWTAPHQVSLSLTISRTLLKLMSIESVMPLNHLACLYPLLLPSMFPSIRVFSNESALRLRWQSIGVSASASVLPMNTQDWSPSGWTGWISLQSKGLSRVFSNTTVQKHQFFGAEPLWLNSHLYMTTGKTIALTRWTFVTNVMSLLFNTWKYFQEGARNNSELLSLSCRNRARNCNVRGQ